LKVITFANSIIVTFLLSFFYAFLINSDIPHSGWFVFIILPLLFYLWQNNDRLEVLFSGFIFGLGLCFFALDWLYSASFHFGVNRFYATVILFFIYFVISLSFALLAVFINVTNKYINNNIISSFVIASWCFLH
jgi:apolipoprotein N-acyltransferase